MQISFSSGNYNIISSGEAFLFEQDNDFKIDIDVDDNYNISIILIFQKEDGDDTYKIKGEINGNKITLHCINFNDLGTGLTKPVSIAMIEGKELLFMFWSHLEGKEKDGRVRSVRYTFFYEK